MSVNGVKRVLMRAGVSFNCSLTVGSRNPTIPQRTGIARFRRCSVREKVEMLALLKHTISYFEDATRDLETLLESLSEDDFEGPASRFGCRL